ncbi:MAG TPA: hypothetical protein VME66_07740, partial [Candidatus Acidoferrales bacterium]|nr:hypothetical protein [Candidatus Acidoferrales bacterium]
MMQTSESTGIDTLYVNMAGVDASIRAPRALLSVLNRTLVHARRPGTPASIGAAIEVEHDEFVWRINGNSLRSRKVLSGASALPQVGGAVVSSLISDVAESANVRACRAAVVERDGRAVAFIGDDWESSVVLTAHLHARGWRLLGGDYALIDPATLTVHATRKLLYVTLSFMDELPIAYRRAVEASPWYSTAHEIAFYAVDPALALTTAPWAEAGRLCALLRLDGHVSEFPSLERARSFAISEDLTSDDLERAGVA